MHIHDTPWGQHRLLVGIAEGRKEGGDTPDALLYSELIRHTRDLTNALTRLAEDIWIVVSLEAQEDLLRDVTWHELLPRLIIDQLYEVIDRELLILVFDLSPIEHQRHTDRDATQDRYRITSLIPLFFKLIETLLLLRGETLLFLILKLLLLGVLFVAESLPIDVNIASARHRLRSPNSRLEIAEVLEFGIRQLE